MATNTYPAEVEPAEPSTLPAEPSTAPAEVESSFVFASNLKTAALGKIREVNNELWLLLSMFVIAAAMNFLLDSQCMLLALYSLPAVYSAYCYGRRHATLTAVASVALIGLLMHFNSAMFSQRPATAVIEERWWDLTIWGGVLVLTTYSMGTLYEHKKESIRELRKTYHGVLLILQQFIAKDQYTQNHSYRVSVYGAKIAEEMRLDDERIEDVRSAALLHDIGKLQTSRQILYKAARLTESELKEMRRHVDVGIQILEPVGGTLRRVLPIILAHHDKFDGSGYHPVKGEDIPLEARILSVADVYDSLTSDRPYRKAMSPFEAKEIIEKGSGSEFDPRVVKAFLSAFRKRELEVPEIVV